MTNTFPVLHYRTQNRNHDHRSTLLKVFAATAAALIAVGAGAWAIKSCPNENKEPGININVINDGSLPGMFPVTESIADPFRPGRVLPPPTPTPSPWFH